MRVALINILLFVTVLVSGQVTRAYPFVVTPSGCVETGAESRWFFENNGDDEEGNNDLTATGGATYDNTSPLLEGSYYGVANGSGHYFAVPSIDYGEEFTLIFEVYIQLTGSRVVIGALDSNDGFRFTIDAGYDDIFFNTGNGSSTDEAAALNCGLSSLTWMQVAVVVDRTAGTALIYLDGSDVTTDSGIRTDFENVTTARIGSTYAGGQWLYGRVDASQLYLWKLSAGNIATINTTPGTEVTQ